MNKTEFMSQLERLLQNISVQERQEALYYYEDYFADAGPENEQAVIEALGNPARVAENIRRDLYGAGYGDGYEAHRPVTGRELTEYEPVRQGMGEAADPAPAPAAAAAAPPWQSVPQPAPAWNSEGQNGGQAGQQGQGGQQGQAGKPRLSGWVIALIVIACILCLPVVGGLLGGAIGLIAGALGTVLGLAAGWFGLILSFGVVALVCFVVGIFFSVVGVAGMGLHPLAGMGLLGSGLIVIGVGILFMMLTVAMAGIVTPAIFRGIRRLFSRKKKKA